MDKHHEEVLASVKKGENAFLTGEPGSGKTWVLIKVVMELVDPLGILL